MNLKVLRYTTLITVLLVATGALAVKDGPIIDALIFGKIRNFEQTLQTALHRIEELESELSTLKSHTDSLYLTKTEAAATYLESTDCRLHYAWRKIRAENIEGRAWTSASSDAWTGITPHGSFEHKYAYLFNLICSPDGQINPSEKSASPQP